MKRLFRRSLPFILSAMLAACAKSPGEQAYIDAGCPQCHGTDRSGTDKGPPLKDLKYVWTAETLDAYLKKPDAFVAQDPRLQALHRKYRTLMPAFVLDDEVRKQMVQYLLEE